MNILETGPLVNLNLLCIVNILEVGTFSKPKPTLYSEHTGDRTFIRPKLTLYSVKCTYERLNLRPTLYSEHTGVNQNLYIKMCVLETRPLIELNLHCIVNILETGSLVNN